MPIYKSLPHCVFQGDENFTNVCVDAQNKIAGLFDYNMSGMDINANYLANNAFMDSFDLEDDVLDIHDAKWIYNEIMKEFHASVNLITKFYKFTELELEAFYLYAKICLFSGCAYASVFRYFIKKPKFKEKCVSLIDLIINWNINSEFYLHNREKQL